MIDIDIINRTSRIRDARIGFMLSGLQAQLNNDLRPAWGLDEFALHLVGRHQQPTPSHWKLWMLNHSDQPSDLGYHEDDTGFPEGKVFVEEDLRYGAEISVTASHELLEMAVDPGANRIGATIGGNQYVLECADPVEADEDGYVINGVRVSNFVLPSYFQPGSKGPWDFVGLLRGPCPMLMPGGYQMFYDGHQWRSTMARHKDGTLSHRAIRQHGRSALRAAV